MMLLVNYDAQLLALARLKELEVVHSGGFAQAKYGEVAGGGGYADMLPSGLVYQVTVPGRDGRRYTFQREALEQTAVVVRGLPNAADREVIELVYLTYGSMAEKAAHVGVRPSTLTMRRERAVERFAHHWQQCRSRVLLARGVGVQGRFVVGMAANDA